LGGTRGEKKKGREKERSKVRQPEQARKRVHGISVTTTMDPAMSSQLSLYAGAEVPTRTGSRRKSGEKEKKSALRGACSVLLNEHLPRHRVHFGTCVSC